MVMRQMQDLNSACLLVASNKYASRKYSLSLNVPNQWDETANPLNAEGPFH